MPPQLSDTAEAVVKPVADTAEAAAADIAADELNKAAAQMVPKIAETPVTAPEATHTESPAGQAVAVVANSGGSLFKSDSENQVANRQVNQERDEKIAEDAKRAASAEAVVAPHELDHAAIVASVVAGQEYGAKLQAERAAEPKTISDQETPEQQAYLDSHPVLRNLTDYVRAIDGGRKFDTKIEPRIDEQTKKTVGYDFNVYLKGSSQRVEGSDFTTPLLTEEQDSFVKAITRGEIPTEELRGGIEAAKHPEAVTKPEAQPQQQSWGEKARGWLSKLTNQRAEAQSQLKQTMKRLIAQSLTGGGKNGLDAINKLQVIERNASNQTEQAIAGYSQEIQPAETKLGGILNELHISDREKPPLAERAKLSRDRMIRWHERLIAIEQSTRLEGQHNG